MATTDPAPVTRDDVDGLALALPEVSNDGTPELPDYRVRGKSFVVWRGPRKDAHLKRLRRIEGQVRGIARMVEEDAYCIDVLTQVSAVTRALQAVSLGLLEEHIAHCVVDAARESDDAAAAKVAEASAAIARLVRS
jgi:DNA-binding FrmR family transcriptional regulator